MINKIRNMKKCIITAAVLICSVFAVNTISDGGVVTTSYASGSALDRFIDLDLGFGGNSSNLTIDDSNVKDASTALNSMIKFIKWIALGGTIVLLGVFVFNLIKMGSAGTNVQARAAAQQGLVWSGLSAAILSIATSIFFFLQGALKPS